MDYVWSISTVNAHIDNCLAQVSMREKRQVIRMQKHKSRTQKKQSIVDICAASPPMEMNVEHLHGMNANSNLAIKVIANGALRDLDTNSIESGKSSNGVRQLKSLETKRRRQRLGTITCILGSKDLKVGLVSYVIISILCYLYWVEYFIICYSILLFPFNNGMHYFSSTSNNCSRKLSCNN